MSNRSIAAFLQALPQRFFLNRVRLVDDEKTLYRMWRAVARALRCRSPMLLPIETLQGLRMNLAGTQPLSDCPVEALGNEARQILAALLAADDALLQDSRQAHAKHEEESEILLQHLQGIAERATHLKAASPAGVLFQLALINDFADMLRRDGNRATDTCNQVYSAIQRMLYSIIAWIEDNTAAKTAEVCDYYLPPERNPHVVIERALQNYSGLESLEGKGGTSAYRRG